MQNFPFKVCDPIHGFIRLDSTEDTLIHTPLFHRLRYLSQLGVVYLVYPSARHCRFSHSLGVMELASHIYDTIIAHLECISTIDPCFFDVQLQAYWKKILRIAALCHDLGHLPFSHTAEKSLLPLGGHEAITLMCLQDPSIASLVEELGADAIADVSSVLSQSNSCSAWVRICHQILTNDNFGADRIDYLLRDAYHTGMIAGSFDYKQLIDSLRIVPNLEHTQSTLGILESGMQAVEGLWTSRYSMYQRVYHHPKCLAYCMHMNQFMQQYYQQNPLSFTPQEYVYEVDYKILSAIAQSDDLHADILMERRAPFEAVIVSEPTSQTMYHYDCSFNHPARKEFPVLSDTRIISSLTYSAFLSHIPVGGEKWVFVDPHTSHTIQS